jgi:hypothetical protein
MGSKKEKNVVVRIYCLDENRSMLLHVGYAESLNDGVKLYYDTQLKNKGYTRPQISGNVMKVRDRHGKSHTFRAENCR